MKKTIINFCLPALLACHTTLAAGQGVFTLPTTEEQTNNIIRMKGQISDVPTVYIWMLDAETNAEGTKPMEYKPEGSTDKNDVYYKIKLNGSSSYDTPISNNIISATPSITDNAVLRPNYGYENPYYYNNNVTKSDEYRLARIKVVDGYGSIKTRDELTTIRGRGNSTWWCEKKAYRLKFPSKTKLLANGDGTNEYADAKNWTLLANAADKTMLRNALTREVGLRIEEKTGLKALPYYPAYQFVDLVINDSYRGTYQISDHNQIQKGRVEINSDRGWFLEAVTGDSFVEEPYVTIGAGNNTCVVNVKNPEDEFLTDEVKAEITDYLSKAFLSTVQYAPGTNDFSEETGLFKYVDMESLVAYTIGNEITGNFDGLISNYVYRDINEGDKLKFGPLWDFDLAYGNYGNMEKTFVYQSEKYSNLKYRVQYLMENCPAFTNLLAMRWKQVYDNGSLITYLHEKVDKIAAEMQYSRQLNYTPRANGGAGWEINSDMLGWGVKTYQDYASAINDVKSFISTHVEFLNTEIRKMQTDVEQGDVNMDGKVDASDLVRVVKHITKENTSLSEDQIRLADMNNDSQITVTDAMKIVDKME